jgi:trimeric autotransporter adhesin
MGAVVFLSILDCAVAVPLSGNRAIGPGGDYDSITAALADVQAQTLDGPLILELQSNYVCSVETFPILFTNLTTTAVNTLTLRPRLGATNLLITGSAPTVDLNGVQFVTIDGRPGGVGNSVISGVGGASQLTIANPHSSGAALSLESATNNTIAYTTFKSGGTYDFDAVVNFLYGDIHNTLDHCDIRDGASTPVNGIIGGTGCENDIISNCNIYNYFAPASPSSGNQFGIALNAGTGWIITGNSFYQTSGRVFGPVSSTIGAINIHLNIFNPVTNHFVISSNSIGGSAPNAGGLPWSIFGSPGNIRFIGIALDVGTAIPTSVQGNVIKNFSWQSSLNLTTVPGVWGGITISRGAANIGTEAANVIGDTNLYSIFIMPSGITNISTGISSTSTNRVVIANNVVTSMRVAGLYLNEPSLIGIAVTAGVNIISNNLVGSSNVISSIIVTNIYTAYGGTLDGINSSSSDGTVITGNIVAGLNNLHNGSGGGSVRGILVTNGVNTVTGNIVRNLITSTSYADTSPTALGISVSSPEPGQTVSQNTVDSLISTSLSGYTWAVGINFSGSCGSSFISRNLVHSLEVYSTNINSRLSAFTFSGGNFTAENNMARVGLAANGTSTASAARVWGILDNATGPGRNFYHNSVYLGGTHDSAATNYTAAFSSSSSNAPTLKNNIFVNARDGSGGTSSHYAADYSGADLTGLISDGNLFLSSGAGAVLIQSTNNGYATLAAWQSASGQDASSFVADPLFLNPTGDATTGNLHIASGSPAIHAGLPVGVTFDIDGDPRNATTPTVGADELFDYTLVSGYNQVFAQWITGGTNAVGFHGIPNSSYALEMATNLTQPVLWMPLATNVSSTNGFLLFTNVTGQSPVFYRTRFVP